MGRPRWRRNCMVDCMCLRTNCRMGRTVGKGGSLGPGRVASTYEICISPRGRDDATDGMPCDYCVDYAIGIRSGYIQPARTADASVWLLAVFGTVVCVMSFFDATRRGFQISDFTRPTSGSRCEGCSPVGQGAFPTLLLVPHFESTERSVPTPRFGRSAMPRQSLPAWRWPCGDRM